MEEPFSNIYVNAPTSRSVVEALREVGVRFIDDRGTIAADGIEADVVKSPWARQFDPQVPLERWLEFPVRVEVFTDEGVPNEQAIRGLQSVVDALRLAQLRFVTAGHEDELADGGASGPLADEA